MVEFTGAGLEEEAPEASRPAAVDDFAVSEDEMDDFIDDDEEGDGSRRKGRVRARGSTQGVSTHGIQVCSRPFLPFVCDSGPCTVALLCDMLESRNQACST